MALDLSTKDGTSQTPAKTEAGSTTAIVNQAKPDNSSEQNQKPFQILDLPLTRDQRDTASALNHKVRKKGEYDRIRKLVFSELKSPETLAKLKQEVISAADKEIEARPSILAGEQANISQLLQGALTRSGVVADMKPLIQLMLTKHMDDAEKYIRQLRLDDLGQEAYTKELESCSKSEEDFVRETEERKLKRQEKYQKLKEEKDRQRVKEKRIAEEARKRRQEEEERIRLMERAEREGRDSRYRYPRDHARTSTSTSTKPPVTEVDLEDMALQMLLGEGQKKDQSVSQTRQNLSASEPEDDHPEQFPRRPIAPPTKLQSTLDPKLSFKNKLPLPLNSEHGEFRAKPNQSIPTAATMAGAEKYDNIVDPNRVKYDQYKPKYESYRPSQPDNNRPRSTSRTRRIKEQAIKRRSRDRSPEGIDRYVPGGASVRKREVRSRSRSVHREERRSSYRARDDIRERDDGREAEVRDGRDGRRSVHRQRMYDTDRDGRGKHDYHDREREVRLRDNDRYRDNDRNRDRNRDRDRDRERDRDGKKDRIRDRDEEHVRNPGQSSPDYPRRESINFVNQNNVKAREHHIRDRQSYSDRDGILQRRYSPNANRDVREKYNQHSNRDRDGRPQRERYFLSEIDRYRPGESSKTSKTPDAGSILNINDKESPDSHRKRESDRNDDGRKSSSLAHRESDSWSEQMKVKLEPKSELVDLYDKEEGEA